MRLLVLFLSLAILFQPASWALGMPMAHAYQYQQIDTDRNGEVQVNHTHEKATVCLAIGIEAHCQRINDEVQTGVMADSDYQQNSHPSINCHSAPSADSLPEAAAIPPSFQYLDVAYHAPSNSFQSRTESPEIRPPHNNIRL
jgi:hypothetical protein